MRDIEGRLEAFLSALPAEEIVRDARARTDGSTQADYGGLLTTFANETRVALDLVRPLLNRDARMLEVGAGLCLFSLFLKREGFRITALEPALGGYGAFAALRDAILARYADTELEVWPCAVDILNQQTHGRFDLIFSSNVLEHIPAWEKALDAMLGVLADDGVMVHGCPNYSVPYEPHYGVLVLRRFPGWSRRLFLPRNADPAIWGSLNFICHRDIRRFARRRNLRVAFRRGMLDRALQRLRTDPHFRNRHRGVAGIAARMLAGAGVLRWLPPSMDTPMVFELRRQVH